MEALPKSVDYGEPLGILPSGTENYNVTCYASNGSSFQAGNQIIVDLNNVGYLDPASLSIRYKLTLTTPLQANAQAAGTSYSIPGCPVYTPILRLDTLFNSNVVESINNYNSVATALSNLNWSISDKMGMQSGLGYYEQLYGACSAGGIVSGLTDYSTTNENTDGLTAIIINAAATTTATNLVYYLSAPLPSLLTNAEKLVPLNGTNIRLQFTLDSLSNVCPTATTTIGAAAPTQGGAFAAYSISNFEVVYNQIQFPPQVERQILSMPKIRIKTSSYATGLQTLGSGVSGTVNLVYNLRYASIKAMLLLMGSSSANGTNKLLESIDMTSGGSVTGTAIGGGSYNFQCNGVYYPQNPLSTYNNRGGVLMELRRAMRNMYSGNSSMSIDNSEWLRGDTNVATTATSINVPAKFYVGVNTQKMDSPALFTGISSQNSPITAIVNIGSLPTQLIYSPILMLYYDAIIEMDVQTKQVNFIY